MTLDDFATSLLEDVLSTADAAAEGQFQEDAFTTLALDILTEHGECVSPQLAYFRAHGVKVNAYDLAADADETLDVTSPIEIDLFVCDLSNAAGIQTLAPSGVERDFARLQTFLEKSMSGRGPEVDESTTVHELKRILDGAATAGRELRVRLMLLTNRLVGRSVAIPKLRVRSATVTHQIWDLERLYQASLLSAGQVRIEVDLDDEFGGSIPCLVSRAPDFDAYLAVVPGRVLAGIYAKYGHRLLEQNVRAFLQARGSVNRAIRKTIAEDPAMFLAYNNGIAATASSVVTSEAHGAVLLSKLLDLQIVNGGQTTASLNDAIRRGVDVSAASVQMKLTVLHNEAQMSSIVSMISRYANSQNKVNLSDLSANERYHVELERLSRVIFASGNQRGKATTKWYFERARGQYADERSRQRAGAERRKWEAQHPRSQLLTKQLAAKYEMTWVKRPWVVSQGSEKNFIQFMEWLAEKPTAHDASYFMRLVSKAIVFRDCDSVVREMDLGGYKANVVTYTVAWLSALSGDRFSLETVWREQGTSDACRALLRGLATEVWSLLSNPPERHRNISEWAKREECWEALGSLEVALPDVPEFARTLLHGIDLTGTPTAEMDVVPPTEPEPWFELAKWGQVTGLLKRFDRDFAVRHGAFLTRGGTANDRQQFNAARIWAYAVQSGFRSAASEHVSAGADE
jgi:hypothetical protein